MQYHLEEPGKVILYVSDWESDEAYHQALDQLIELTKDVGKFCSNAQLLFEIYDQNELYRDNDNFFEAAIKIEGAAEKMKTIVLQYIQYDKAPFLFQNEEDTVMWRAVYELIYLDFKYAETALDYITEVDCDWEWVLDALNENYGDTEEYGDKLQTLLELYGRA